jgi:hypothetical protein
MIFETIFSYNTFKFRTENCQCPFHLRILHGRYLLLYSSQGITTCQDTDIWDGKMSHENPSVRDKTFTFEFERISEDGIYSYLLDFRKREYEIMTINSKGVWTEKQLAPWGRILLHILIILSASQEIPHILWKLEFHYCVRKSTLLVAILRNCYILSIIRSNLVDL